MRREKYRKTFKLDEKPWESAWSKTHLDLDLLDLLHVLGRELLLHQLGLWRAPRALVLDLARQPAAGVNLRERRLVRLVAGPVALVLDRRLIRLVADLRLLDRLLFKLRRGTRPRCAQCASTLGPELNWLVTL